jgi:hypothetical protein
MTRHLPALVEHPTLIAAAFSAVIGAAYLHGHPFPSGSPPLVLVASFAPRANQAFRAMYVLLAFSTPCLALSVVWSFAYVFLVRIGPRLQPGRLPPYSDPARRTDLFLVLGEVHEATRAVPAQAPRWLTIPDRGLFTGVAIVGAIGTGKTSGCMYPYADQLLGYRAADPERRLSGLVLEVKGDFCYKLRELLARHGRADDYLEVSLDGQYRYNPLHNDLEAYALAYGIASLLNNLFGHSEEPFWQQAYTNLVKFLILLHKVVDDYVTLFDVYQAAINPDRIAELLAAGERRLSQSGVAVVVDRADVERCPELAAYEWVRDPPTGRVLSELTPALERVLQARAIPYAADGAAPGAGLLDLRRLEQWEAVQRWFQHDWMRIEPKLRTSIIEGISVFLSLFDDNPSVKYTFCPPKACYDPVANADGRHGRPLPPFPDLVEAGRVVALNFPVVVNPGLARMIGTFLKQDFQRAVLGRIPRMAREPDRPWREVLFLCDEYHAFATVGEQDPTGDEKFFALSRQARCIPIVATQSLSSLRSALPRESWRTLLQTFRTKVFLALSDDFSAKVASDLCGRREQLVPQYSISENDQGAGVSFLTGRTTANRATISASKTYKVERNPVFEPKTFAELQNGQAVVLAYDGLNPQPPTLCYLKPDYLDPNETYFEQRARGVL